LIKSLSAKIDKFGSVDRCVINLLVGLYLYVAKIPDRSDRSRRLCCSGVGSVSARWTPNQSDRPISLISVTK